MQGSTREAVVVLIESPLPAVEIKSRSLEIVKFHNNNQDYLCLLESLRQIVLTLLCRDQVMAIEQMQ